MFTLISVNLHMKSLLVSIATQSQAVLNSDRTQICPFLKFNFNVNHFGRIYKFSQCKRSFCHGNFLVSGIQIIRNFFDVFASFCLIIIQSNEQSELIWVVNFVFNLLVIFFSLAVGITKGQAERYFVNQVFTTFDKLSFDLFKLFGKFILNFLLHFIINFGDVIWTQRSFAMRAWILRLLSFSDTFKAEKMATLGDDRLSDQVSANRATEIFHLLFWFTGRCNTHWACLFTFLHFFTCFFSKRNLQCRFAGGFRLFLN